MKGETEIRTFIIRKEYPLNEESSSETKRTTFRFLAEVESRALSFRKSAKDLTAGLSDYEKRRFQFTFNFISNQIEFQARYIRQLFNPDNQKSSLLDIGRGPGILAKKLLSFYKEYYSIGLSY